MATDQKQYHDFSELEVFGQQNFHHGRGQLNMEETDRFYDSWNMDLRFPGKAFPALAPTESGDLAGAINDMVYYEHHAGTGRDRTLFAVAETGAATTTNTITASADDVEEGSDTTYDATSTTAKVGAYPAAVTVNIPIDSGAYDAYQIYYQLAYTEYPTGSNLRVGTDYSPYGSAKQRSYLSFPTGDSLPDGVTITSASLFFYLENNYTNTNFNLRVRKHPGWTPTLADDDWRTDGHQLNADWSTVQLTSGWHEISLNASPSYLTDISSTARTELCLSSDREETGATVTHDEYFSMYSYEYGDHSRAPYLRVTYTSGLGSFDMGLRFQSVAIPNAANPTSAKITVKVSEVIASTAVRIYGLMESAGQASLDAFSSSTDRPSQKLKTASYVAWTVSTSGVQDTPDLSTVVNEIVDKATWASNSHMGFVFLDQGNAENHYCKIVTYDGDPTNDAVLTVDYTGSGANKIYYLHSSTSVWTDEDATPGTTGLATSGGGGSDVEVFNHMLVVAQHNTANARKYRPGDTPAWDDLGVKAKFFKTHDGCLWRATYNPTETLGVQSPRWEVHYSANADADTPTWSEITLLRSPTPITGLDSYSNLLTVHYEDGMWQVEKDPQGSYRAFRPINQTPVRDVYNGRAHVVFKERYYYSERHGMVEYDGNGIQYMGPDRADIDPELDPNSMSLVASNRGPIIGLTQDGEFMWALTYSPYTYTPNQNVLVFNSQGWSHYASGPSGTASNNGVIHYQARIIASSNPKLNSYDTLWFTAGSKIYYIAFDPYFRDPSAYDAVNGSAFQTSCKLKTSWHGPLPIVPKNWMRLLVDWTRVEGIVSSLSATFINDGGNGLALPTIYSSGLLETNIPFGNLSLEGVVGRRARCIFTLTTAASTYSRPPMFNGYNYRYAYRPSPRLGWTIPAAVYAEQDLLDRTKESVATLTTRRKLQQLAGQSPLKFNDGSPPISAFNELYNPSFEGPFTGTTPQYWSEFNGPIGGEMSYLKAPVSNPGGYSWSLTFGNSCGLRTTQTFSLSPGVGCRASVWGMSSSSTDQVGVEIRISSTNVLVASNYTSGVGWVRASVSYNPSAAETVYMAVVKTTASMTRTYFDCAELILDKDYPLTEYLDGEQPRCAWTGVPHASRSERRGYWLVYITGLTEANRFGSETAAGTETWGSQVTLALREV
jgi:hypothetical protein